MGDQGAEPFLTRHDDLPAQRAWRAAKPGQHLLRPVSGLARDPVLVASLHELDGVAADPPPNVRHVGPAFD